MTSAFPHQPFSLLPNFKDFKLFALFHTVGNPVLLKPTCMQRFFFSFLFSSFTFHGSKICYASVLPTWRGRNDRSLARVSQPKVFERRWTYCLFNLFNSGRRWTQKRSFSSSFVYHFPFVRLFFYYLDIFSFSWFFFFLVSSFVFFYPIFI